MRIQVVKKDKINDKGEYVGKVFVSLLQLMGHKNKESFTEQSLQELRTEYKLIQELKKIRGTYKDIDEDDDLVLADEKKTIIDIEKEIIRKRCDKMRPEHSWKEVAESLGIAKKTLYDKRKKLGIHSPESQ